MKMIKFKVFFVTVIFLGLPFSARANTLGSMEVYPSGSNPRGLVTADLDGDGIAEAIVANFGAATLIGQTTTASVNAGIQIFSHGAKGLEIKQSLIAGKSPRGLAVLDLDGDGDLDLLVTNYDGGTLGSFLQDGTGHYGTMRSIKVGTHPVGVAAVTLRGVPVVAVANYDDDNVSLFKASALGDLEVITVLPVGSRPTDVELYAEGSQLLLVSTNYMGNSISVIPVGLGGQQGDMVTMAAPGNPCKILVGDLTGDGQDDLVVAKFSTSEVSIYARQATGFSSEAETVQLAGSHPNGIALGDVAGLGQLAIISANRDSDTIDVVGRGQDGKLQVLVSLPASSPEDTVKTFGPVEASVNDLDGDGLADIAFTHMRSGSLRVFKQALPLAPVLVSSSHPDQESWYPQANLSLSWDAVEDLNGIDRYVYSLDQFPGTVPDSAVASVKQTEVAFLGLDTGTFYAHVRAVDIKGNLGSTSHFRVQITSEMSQENVYNYPNPSRDGRTTIRFPLVNPSATLIRIYDEFGNLVWSRDLSAGETIAGVNTLIWEGRNDRGQAVGNGGYILQVSAAGKTVTKKIAIVR